MSKILAACGSNIFGQWFNGDLVISEFLSPKLRNRRLTSDAKLCYSAWAYNIILQNGEFYIIGAWSGVENSFLKIEIPLENQSETPDLLIVGDDEKLFLIHRKTFKMWLYKFKIVEPNTPTTWDWVLLPPLNTVGHSEAKKDKKRKSTKVVIKAIIANHLVYLLISDGSLYEMPTEVDTSHVDGKITGIDGGYEHVIIVTDTGKVYTWGNGRRCQLGHGSLCNQEVPTEVEALGGIKIVKVKAGGWHCIALSDTGDLYAWGWNESGQLGIQKLQNNRLVGSTSHPLPYLVDLYDNSGQTLEVNVIDMACGSRHSVILLENNTVWSTGLNQYGQLGASGVKSLDRFKKVYECTGRVNLVCGPWCSVVLN